MTATEATGGVFWTAFRALPREAQRAVLVRLVKEDTLRCDLLDLATIEKRRTEPERPLRDYLAERDPHG